MAYGFQYKPLDEFATAQTEERLAHLKALETNKGELQKPSKNDSDSLLGIVDRPQILLSQAFAIYCYKIATSKLIGKSEVQKKAWKKVNTRDIANLTHVYGDLSMSEISRGHARAFHEWWAGRIMPNNPKLKALTANSGNRDVGNMNKLFRQYWEHEGDEERKNPFRKLRIVDNRGKDIPHFSNEWVRPKILAPGIFDGLNWEAALLVYGLIETGYRPSELANLLPQNIKLNAPIPHIYIRNSQARQLKSTASIRDSAKNKLTVRG